MDRLFAISVALTALIAGLSGCSPASSDRDRDLSSRTSDALLDQLRCAKPPQTARAIDAMLKNHLIRYVADESGVYLFEPTKPLGLFGLSIIHVSGFDYEGFEGAPGSFMAGTAPPVFLEIDVAATQSELRARAVKAGLVEADYSKDRRGFEVDEKGLGSYLAKTRPRVMSSIRCAA